MLVALLALTTQAWATEPKVYTTAVVRDDLNVGDILIEGATITSNEQDPELIIAGGSYKLGESIANDAADIFNYAPLTIGENGIFSISNQNYTPYDNTAQNVGNAWVVIGNEMEGLSIAGTTYTVVDPNAVAVTPTENANEWSFTMPAGNIVLQVEYFDPLLTLAVNDSTMGYVGIKQQGFTKIAELTPTASETVDYAVINNGAAITGDFFVNTSTDGSANVALHRNTDAAYNNTAYVIFRGPGNNSYQTDASGGFAVYLKNGNTYSDYQCTQLLWEGGVHSLEVYVETFSLPEGVTMNADGTYNVKPGTEITIEAVPYMHHYFAGWTGTTETAATITLTVEEDMELTANFAENSVLTLASNSTTMGTVGIEKQQGEEQIAILVAADMAGQEEPALPSGIRLYGPQVGANETEWFSNDTENRTDLEVSSEQKLSHIIFYGRNARYIAESFKENLAVRKKAPTEAPRKMPAGGSASVYLKNGNTYMDRYCTNMLWEGGVTRIEVYIGGEVLPQGVTLIDAEEGTYSVPAGCNLNVVATPKPRHYLDSWTKDNVPDETNTTETYALTMGTDSVTLLATFAENPTLTLAANDETMGTVDFDFTPYDTETTICDGTETNNTVPVYLNWFDALTKSQHVIPAAMLADVAGSTISGLTYYMTEYVPWTSDVDVDVYVKEVDYTTINAMEDKTTCTTVYTGKVTITDEGDHGEWTITFNEPFAYNGGNLLVGVENLEQGTWKGIGFMGVTAEGASYGGNDSNLDQQNFLPKTTIHYTAKLPAGVLANEDGTYSVKPGSDLTVKATPAEKYHLDSWSNDAEVNDELTNSFTMATTDLELMANFSRDSYKLTIGAGKFATFFAAESVALSAEQATAGAALYTITAVDGEHTTASLSPLGNVVAAEMPMVVYNGSEAQMTVVLTPTTDAPTVTTVEPIGQFHGTATDREFTDADMEAADYYALSGGVAFAPVKGAGTLKANQCWLQFPNNASFARSIRLVFNNDETTSIHNSQFTIDNSQFTIDNAAATIYDLQGRKVNGQSSMVNGQLKKGVYIKNGTKVVK